MLLEIYILFKNTVKTLTWDTSWPVWSFIVVVIIACQFVTPRIVIWGKSVVASSATCVIKMATAASGTRGVVVSQSQICLWRWLRSIETVNHWENIKLMSTQLTCAGRQRNQSSSKLPGLVSLTSQVVRCWEASVWILKFKAQFLAPVAVPKK